MGSRVARKLTTLFALFLIAPAAVFAQEIQQAVTIDEVWLEEGELRFSVETSGLFDAEAERTIRQGGTAALDYAFELYRQRKGWFDTLVKKIEILPFRVGYDSFERQFRVESTEIRIKTDDFQKVVEPCTRLSSQTWGPLDELKLDDRATYYIVVRARYQPMAVETIDELREWVSGSGNQQTGQDSSRRRGEGVGSRIARVLMSAAGFGEEELRGESATFKLADLPVR